MSWADPLGAGRRRRLRGVRVRVVDAEMDDACVRRFDELLGERVVAGVSGEEHHPVGRGEGQLGQIAVIPPRLARWEVGGVVERDQVLLGQDQPLAERLEEAQVAGVAQLKRAVDDVGAARRLAVGGEIHARQCPEALAGSLTRLVGEDRRDPHRRGAGEAGDKLEHVDVGPGGGPGQDPGVDRDRQSVQRAARGAGGAGFGCGWPMRARSGRLGVEHEDVVGQHVRESALDAAGPGVGGVADQLERAAADIDTRAARRLDPRAQPKRAGPDRRGGLLERLAAEVEVMLGESGGGGGGGARVGGVAQPVEPVRRATAPGAEQDDVGRRRGGKRAGGRVGRLDFADDDVRHRGPRAISISVWPNGAVRGREPSRSTGANARWSRGDRRRQA